METPGSQSKEFIEGWFRALGAVVNAMEGDMDINRFYQIVLDARQELFDKEHPELKGMLWK